VARNRTGTVVVDMASLARDHLRSGDALLLGLVRQHGSLHNIANGVNVRDVRAPVVVNSNAAAVIGLDTLRRRVGKCYVTQLGAGEWGSSYGLLQRETSGVRAATHGNQHDVALHLNSS
jgi:hypothetical protein